VVGSRCLTASDSSGSTGADAALTTHWGLGVVDRVNQRRDTKNVGEENELLTDVCAHLASLGEEVDRCPRPSADGPMEHVDQEAACDSRCPLNISPLTSTPQSSGLSP
jgi:hypothetical protein